MDGILIIDKPAGITSHDVVSRVRRTLKIKRIGHTGTLDPFATGVMVILIGRATRLARFLEKDEKEYEALVRFGFETDTGDRTGVPKPHVQESPNISAAQVGSVLPLFRGEIEQVPPMYSAKKIAGRKLYESARKGIEVRREPVKIFIHSLEIISGSEIKDSGPEFLWIRVTCSAGTYIRTLAEDIGRKLGVGAHLAELRRTRAGKFDLARAGTIEQLAELADPASAIIPMEEAVAHLPLFTLTEERAEKTRSGLSTRVFDAGFTDGEIVRMVEAGGKLVAIGSFRASENVIQPKVVLV